MTTLVVVFYLCLSVLVECAYPPIGDEVIPGSVLLPATRRGRYLANIVRRQAVDGTGIKFNKDADRMNAEAKKKVDVLSEELLPYIIAEQERRTTLYKRVMTAIQNGEKGVTIAEIRNKPPLVIRKGLMFRCPSNRAPKEPDGSGIITCEGDIEPTPVMYDSCLSAEDKDLYVAENKYFFCNRHKVEGPDLPRNGTTVIGCAPIERTSLNYTSSKCALEDTDDVVVHYRYYPDRTYKFVTELDPDREVCDHWNPCQIGYIYSLPSPDQALPANELWRDYVDRNEEYERDEIVPPIAEDTPVEYVSSDQSDQYSLAPRNVKIPTGYTFDSVWKQENPYKNSLSESLRVSPSRYKTRNGTSENSMVVEMDMSPRKQSDYGKHYAVFVKGQSRRASSHEKSVLIVDLVKSNIYMEHKTVTLNPGATMDPEKLEYRCNKCRITGIMVRTEDAMVHNLSPSRWRTEDSDGVKRLEVDVTNARPKDFGTYMVRFTTDGGEEELIPSIKLLIPGKDKENMLKAAVFKTSAAIGEQIDKTISYTCEECELTDVTCNGESMVTDGKVSIVSGMKMITINIASFSDNDACVYVGVFKKDSSTYSKVVSVIDNKSPAVTVENADEVVQAPAAGEPLEHTVRLRCDDGDCHANKVSVNGIELDAGPTRRTDSGPTAYYRSSGNTLTIYISSFSEIYEGVYMAVFNTKEGPVTKSVAQIGGDKEEGGADSEPGATTAGPGGVTAEPGASTAPPSGAPPPGDAPPGDAPPSDAPAPDAPPAA